MPRAPTVALSIVVLLFAVAALAPSAANAAQCAYSAPRNLQLDLGGVQTVRIEVQNHDVHVRGTPAGGLTLTGRACASDRATLEDLTITQSRQGSELLLDLGSKSRNVFRLFGSSYAYLDVTLQLPTSLPITVNVGSGDADVAGVQQVRAQVGSGDLNVRNIAQRFAASVGSGDIAANDLGKLEIGTVGSGDFKASAVRGDVQVGSIGSGDVQLRQVGGSVRVQALGSGDLTVDGASGDFSLDVKGSGDVTHSGVKGKVSVPRDD